MLWTVAGWYLCAWITRGKHTARRCCEWRLMYRKILYELRDGIARITLNRPEKRNALDGEIIAELKAGFGASASDDACRVVLLTGAGTDFCSGADLANLEKTAQNSVLDNLADARATADLFLMMRNHPRAVIAAVLGGRRAGGWADAPPRGPITS